VKTVITANKMRNKTKTKTKTKILPNQKQNRTIKTNKINKHKRKKTDANQCRIYL
jgi:hypothetical protein